MRRRRGFFMGLMFLGLFSTISLAQVDCFYSRISVSRVQGTVFDQLGEPIPNVEIKLRNDGKEIANTETNEAGQFAIPAAPGRYDLQANARGFAPGFTPIDVGHDLARALKPAHLWMILVVGSSLDMDTCPLATTS